MNFEWINIERRQGTSEFNKLLKIFMKILWEGDVKPTHSESERKNFSFLLDYFFAGDVRYDSAKLLLHLVQNPVQGRFMTRQEAQLLSNPIVKQAYEFWEELRANWPSLSKVFVYIVSASFRKFLLSSELQIIDPRNQASCVISRFVPANAVDYWCSSTGLTINWHFGGLRRYTYWDQLSELVDECSDIFQLTDDATIISIPFLCHGVIANLVIRGRIAILYIAIARGSPCNVPFWDRMVDLPKQRWDGWL